MYTTTKYYVHTHFIYLKVGVFGYNKSIKKFPTKSFSLCLSNNTPKGVYLYDYYIRIKDKAGADLE